MPRKVKPSGDYEVGYGKPPQHTRFKPGQSGNPKGRRKGVRNLKSIIEEELYRPVSIVEGGRRRNVPAFQVIFRQSVTRAAKGEARAFSALAQYIQRMGLMEEDVGPGPVAQAPLSADEAALLREFFAEAKAGSTASAEDEMTAEDNTTADEAEVLR